MITTTFSQPERQLGAEFSALLASGLSYRRIVFVSAFTALRTILRLREGILAAADAGATIRLTVGIDLGGTSREVLEELSRWDCQVFLYHNPIPRATFHPKIYLFESEFDATLFVGSNNLTEGGLYTNYEAATRYVFNFPADTAEYERLLLPIRAFLDPSGPTVCSLDAPLIETLSARGVLPTEAAARRNRRDRQQQPPREAQALPPNPFSAVTVPWPPLLPRDVRGALHPTRAVETPPTPTAARARLPRPEGILVWKKKLTASDALQVRPGTHHVGGVRLTQARFENPPGHRIDQTTYFRTLFDDFDWEPETRGHPDQEHAFVPVRIIILGQDRGIRNLEISHKPSGEAGQANYTTILRWGRSLNNVIARANLTGKVLSLYETEDSNAPFFLEVTNS